MTINGKEKVMLACMAVLIIFMASIFLRLGTRMVLVKKLHMDNAVTQVVLFDQPVLQSRRAGMDDPRNNKINMHWAEKYPFQESEQVGGSVKLKAKISAWQVKIKHLEDAAIAKWTNERLPFYPYMVESGMKWNNLLRWRIVEPAIKVYQLQDGYLSSVSSRDPDSEARINSIVRLARFVEAHGGRFLYVQTPGKANKYADRELDKLDYSNINSDLLLEGLAKKSYCHL